MWLQGADSIQDITILKWSSNSARKVESKIEFYGLDLLNTVHVLQKKYV